MRLDRRVGSAGMLSGVVRRVGSAGMLSGVVRRVEPSAFTKVSAPGVEEQRVNVIIDITSPPAQWRNLGDACRVDARIVVHSAADAVIAPVAALFRDGGRWAVFVTDGDVARRRLIEVTHRGSRDALVVDGLSPGDRVIVYPGDSVRDGGRIRARAGEAG